MGGTVSETNPAQPNTGHPARRRWPAAPGLGGAAIAVGLVAAAWAWYVPIPAMYVSGWLLAAAGAGLLVAGRLAVARTAPRAIVGAGLAVALTVGAMFVPGWRQPESATDVVVWRAPIPDSLQYPRVSGDSLWLVGERAVWSVDRDTGSVVGRINVHVVTTRPTGWGVAIRGSSNNGTAFVAAYRPDGTRMWRFSTGRRSNLHLSAARGGVIAVVACREPDDDGGHPKTCRATGLGADGERVWTRQVSQDAATNARNAQVLLSKQEGRWHFVDPKTGRDIATSTPRGFVRPWVAGNLAVFTRPGEGGGCEVVAYRNGRRAWQHRMRGSACDATAAVRPGGWAYYEADTVDDDQYLVDTRAGTVKPAPEVPGEDWLSYRRGVLTSKAPNSDSTSGTVYGTEVATGNRRWTHEFGEGYATGASSGPVAVFQHARYPVDGDDYSPDARTVTVYSAPTGHQVFTTRLAEGSARAMRSLSGNAVLFGYDDHVTYVGPP